MSSFCGFLASFSLEYDISDAILQDIDKMKVQYFMSLLSDLFTILQSVRSEQRNSTQMRKIGLSSKTKDYCFLTIRRVYHHFASKLDTTCSNN